MENKEEKVATLDKGAEYTQVAPITATEIILEELYKVVDEIKNIRELPLKINLLNNVENTVHAIRHLKEAGTKPCFDKIIEQAIRWRKAEEDKHKTI